LGGNLNFNVLRGTHFHIAGHSIPFVFPVLFVELMGERLPVRVFMIFEWRRGMVISEYVGNIWLILLALR
jgi:hypothetical protein